MWILGYESCNIIVQTEESARYLDFICTPKFLQTGVMFSFPSNCLYILRVHQYKAEEKVVMAR